MGGLATKIRAGREKVPINVDSPRDIVVVVFVTMISIVYRYRSILAFPLEFIGHILKHLVITNHYT